MKLDLRTDGDAISFPVRVVPRAHADSLAGVREGALVVRLTAPPVEGKANACLQAFLARLLGVRKGQVRIRTGEKSRTKVISVEGLDAAEARALLGDN